MLLTQNKFGWIIVIGNTKMQGGKANTGASSKDFLSILPPKVATHLPKYRLYIYYETNYANMCLFIDSPFWFPLFA